MQHNLTVSMDMALLMPALSFWVCIAWTRHPQKPEGGDVS